MSFFSVAFSKYTTGRAEMLRSGMQATMLCQSVLACLSVGGDEWFYRQESRSMGNGPR